MDDEEHDHAPQRDGRLGLDTAVADARHPLDAAAATRAGRPIGGAEQVPALVVLDLGGVLLVQARRVLTAPLAEDGAVPAAVDAAYDALKVEMWSGRLRPTAAWERLLAAAGRPAVACPWRDDAPPPGLDALPAMSRLRFWAARTRLAVLSNQRTEWVLPLLAAAGVDDVLSPLWISSRTGHVKPAPEAFAQMLTAGVPAERILFVDDQPRNLEGAARLGIRTLRADPGGAWADAVDRLLGTEPVQDGG